MIATDITPVDKTEMRESTRENIKVALVRYYNGDSPSYKSAFDDTSGIARDTFYRYKREQPELIDQIDSEARAIAARGKSSIQTASDAHMMHDSLVMQHRATEVLGDVLEELARIATRQPLEMVIGKNKDGTPKTKILTPYARDAVAAAGIIQSIARDGVLPERARRVIATVITSAAEKEADVGVGQMPTLGLSTNFRKVTAVAADGTEFMAELKSPIEEVIDAEFTAENE